MSGDERILGSEAAEIAVLARLALGPEECAELATELGAILEHMAVLDEVDTDGIEPMTHVTDVDLRLRPDEVTESIDQHVALSAAPHSDDGYFVVPAAIHSK